MRRITTVLWLQVHMIVKMVKLHMRRITYDEGPAIRLVMEI